jgi:immune inhibitor A
VVSTGRATTGTVVALLVILGLACGGDDNGPTSTPTATPKASATITASPSASPTANPDAEPPERDLLDLAHRYRGVPANSPRLARDAPFGYQVGSREEFNVLDLTGPSVRTIGATVRQITDHAYFFVEEGIPVSQGTLDRIGSDFETIVYPTVHARFGSEWTPGVDSDPRISIFHGHLLGAGGYFSGGDEFPAAVSARSNGREGVFLDSEVLGAAGTHYNALLAHELQHLVHWRADQSEDSWVNEGLSQVSAEEVGGGHDWLSTFLATPDTQLTFWPPYESAAIHYAAAELFMSYLLDHYGGRGNAAVLLAQQADSIRGVQAYLDPFGKKFADVFADWVVANYLDLDSGPYSHPSTDAETGATTPIGTGPGEGDVSQWGADYLKSETGGTFSFDGADEVTIGIPALDGAFWWANRGDGVDSRLTREFDLTSVTSATLRFSTWYDIEYGWDYAYVAASTDGGTTWQSLPATNTTDFNPVEAAYGTGYTGQSGSWTQEEVNLSAYAGKKALLRFEQVTDDATSLTGFAVDDIEVPELGFRDGADTDSGWTVEGFKRIEGPRPQQFIVQVIRGDQVTRVALDGANRGQLTLDGPATIVVSGATDGTAEKAHYAWTLSP